MQRGSARRDPVEAADRGPCDELHELLVDALKRLRRASEGAGNVDAAGGERARPDRKAGGLPQHRSSSDEITRTGAGSASMTILLSTLPEQTRATSSRGLDASTDHARRSLPERLVRRLQAPDGDGRARVQTFPSENLEDHEAFTRFVSIRAERRSECDGHCGESRRVRSHHPGSVSAGDRNRRIGDRRDPVAVVATTSRYMLLVLAPLALAGCSDRRDHGGDRTCPSTSSTSWWFHCCSAPASTAAFTWSSRRAGENPRKSEVLGTTTARAVLFSALTTITSFGTLGFSSHVGLSGLGTLLTVGNVAHRESCNLIVLPALLAKFWRSPTNNS